MSLFSLCLVLVMQLSVLPSTLTILPVVRAQIYGTRVDIIAQLNAWIGEKDHTRVYWLTGLAGLGKTTIAYTICKSLDEAHIPSFVPSSSTAKT